MFSDFSRKVLYLFTSENRRELLRRISIDPSGASLLFKLSVRPDCNAVYIWPTRVFLVEIVRARIVSGGASVLGSTSQPSRAMSCAWYALHC